jgi:hypothetical protein
VGGRERFAETRVSLRRSDREDPASNEDAFALLTIAVKDPDADKVGRAFSGRAVEMALASYPGFAMTSPPGDASQFGVYWPALVRADAVRERVVFEGESGESIEIAPAPRPAAARAAPPAPGPAATPPAGPTRVAPLGALFGARSGDKGGNANLGVWARTPEAYAWLVAFLDVPRLRALLPETRELPVERHLLPNLLAMNFVIAGLLGDGVAASLRADPQAKTLGEYLRARRAPIPAKLLPQ